MATNPTLTISVNGGPPQTGGIYVDDADVLSFSKVNTTGWLRARWEIYDYPEGFTCPAGWSTDTDDDVRPTYYKEGIADPPDVTLDGWGPYKSRLIVNDVDVDERTFAKVLSPSGFEAQASGEEAQFGGTKLQKDKAYNANLQLIEDATAIFLTTPGVAVAAPPAVAAASALGDASAGIAFGNHTHQGVKSLSVTAPVTNSGTSLDPNVNVSAATTAARGTQSISHYSEQQGEPATITSGRAPVAFVRTGTKWINPTSSTPCADILAAHTAGYHAQLNGDATYTLETTLALASGKSIVCKDSLAILVPNGSFTGVGADSDANYVWRAASTVAGVASGTTQATSYMGDRKMRWNFSPTNGASYLIATGNAGIAALSGHADQQYNAGRFGYELVKVVSSAFVSGSNYDVLLDRDLNQPHYTGSSVYLVSTPVDDIEIAGLRFSFAGSTHAVGIVANAVRRLTLDNVHFQGFSRAGLSALRGGTVDLSIVNRGGANATVYLDSISASRVRVSTIEGGDRYHASGVPRGLITLRGNCCNVEIVDSQLVGACTGISMYGGIGVRIRNSEIRDMDPTQRVAQDSTINTAPVGSAARTGGLDINGFTTGGTDTMWSYDTEIDGLDLSNCRGISSGGSLRWPAAIIIDVRGVRASRIGIHNPGAGATGAQAAAPVEAGPALGLMLNDAFQVQIETLNCHGIALPIMISGNGATGLHVGTVNVHNRDAYTSTSFNLLSIEDPTCVVHINRVRFYDPLTGYFGYSALGSTPVAAAMENVTIDTIEDVTNGNIWDGCFFAKTTMNCAIGERIEVYNNAGVRSARNPSTTYNDDKAIVFMPYGRNSTSATSGDWAMVSRGPRYCVASTENPARGAIMTAGTTRDVIEHVAGAPLSAVGMVTRVKAAGLIQLDRAGEAQTGSTAKTASTWVVRDTSGGSAFTTVTCDDLLFPAGETTPSISQTVAASGAGANLAIRPQQGASGSADGALIVGQDNGASDASGPVRIVAGQVGAIGGRSAYTSWAQTDVSTPWLDVYRYAGSLATIHAGGTDHLYLASSYKVWVGIAPFGAGAPYMDVDQNTGFLHIVGANGGLRARTAVGTATWFEVAYVAASRNVVGLCVGANLDTTKMPANTGNGVVFIGNCTAAPTADCNSTGVILWSDTQQLKVRANTVQEDVTTKLANTSGTASSAVVHTKRDFTLTTTTTTADQKFGAITLLASKGGAVIRVSCTGYDTSGDGLLYAERLYRVKDVSGTLTISQTDTIGTDSLSGGSVSAGINGTDVEFRVTPGGTANTRWHIHIEAVANYIT